MEQILDTARRADRDHCRRETILRWGLDCEIHEGVLEGEHQEQKSSVSVKANIEEITEQVKELVCEKKQTLCSPTLPLIIIEGHYYTLSSRTGSALVWHSEGRRF